VSSAGSWGQPKFLPGTERRFLINANQVWLNGLSVASRREISPYGGNGKLPWKVDWAAHWKVVGITIEGAGKDHASKGVHMISRWRLRRSV